MKTILPLMLRNLNNWRRVPLASHLQYGHPIKRHCRTRESKSRRVLEVIHPGTPPHHWTEGSV
jgi:hypothetical protein